MAKILGLTGPIASGKTTVGDILLELGALERIDADKVVHELMLPGTRVTSQIRQAFGPQVLRVDGSVDRKSLGEIVFADPEALQQLEGIVHPGVRDRIRQRIEELGDHQGVLVVDAVKLLQSPLVKLCDAIWVLCCSRQVQMKRLIEGRGMSRQDVERRMKAQPSFDDVRVTEVIDNSGSTAHLRQRVEGLWKRISSNQQSSC